MKNWEEVDRHSRDLLQNWSEEPSPQVAEKIKKRMFWIIFWRSGIIANLKYIIPSAIIILGFSISALLISGNKLINESGSKIIAEKNTAGKTINQHAFPEASKIKNKPGRQIALQNQAKTNRTIYTANKVNNSAKPNQNVLPDKKEKNTTGNAKINTIENKPELPKLTASENDKNKTPEISKIIILSGSTDQQKQTVSASKSENILPDALSMMPIRSHFPYIECCNKQLVATEPIDSKLAHSKSNTDFYFGFSPSIVSFGNTQEKVKTFPGFPSGTISVGLDYHYKNMFLESGLQYSHFQMKESGDQLLYNPQNIVTQTYAGQLQVIDSSSFWHSTFVVDSLVHFIDSIWETNYDTTVTDIYIPVTSTKYDTLKGHHSWKANISMIEIPLLVGYRFSIARTELSLKAGILFGIITESGGYTYYKSSPTGLLRISDAYSTRKIQCSYIIAASINRFITEHWSLEFTPYMRSSLIGLKTKVEGIPSRNYMAWGLGVGFRYKF